MNITLDTFLTLLGRQRPLIAVQGNIFDTPAQHIAFAVHWPNKEGHSNNDNGGFSSLVAAHGWKDLGGIVFEKGVPQSRRIGNKTFHALPVHTPEDGGWEETPGLIAKCLNALPVTNNEVIAIVLIGGGNAGHKYKASVNNLEGMIGSTKTVVLYVYENPLYQLLVATGVVAQPIPNGIPLSSLPAVTRYRDSSLSEAYKLRELAETAD